MVYSGRYAAFDPLKITTYPVSERTNRVKLGDLVDPQEVLEESFSVCPQVRSDIVMLASQSFPVSKK
jgi:hypothetical protein